VNGQFDQVTEDAVIKFQKKSKLQADGIVGSYTWAALTT
jgi:peptidoglycan hydrolase-like protein with peptidoglycan-binding domain